MTSASPPEVLNPIATTGSRVSGRLPGEGGGLPQSAWLAKAVPFIYVLPAVLVMAFGLAYPIVDAVRLSFFDWPMGTDFADTARFVGFDSFARMLQSPQVWTSMGVTLAFIAIAVTAEMVLGIALALVLEKPVRGMRFFRTVFILPMMIAPICVGLIWRYLFDASFGPINQALALVSIAPHAWLADPQTAFAAMVVVDIWQWTPFVLIMVLAGLQGLDSSVIEAARIDGANAWQQIVRVKLPIIKPILIVTLLARMIDGFRGPRGDLRDDLRRPRPEHRTLLAAHLQGGLHQPEARLFGGALAAAAGDRLGAVAGHPADRQPLAHGGSLVRDAEMASLNEPARMSQPE